MSKSPLNYIEHILIEIDFLQRERKNKTEEIFSSDETLQRAFTRSVEIIGEAVKNIDNNIKGKYPAVNWKAIAGMRDKLIHHYFGIDYSLVWDVVENKIDQLKEDLENIKKNECF